MSENPPDEFTEAQVESIRALAKEVFGEIFKEAINACIPVLPKHLLLRARDDHDPAVRKMANDILKVHFPCGADSGHITPGKESVQ